MFVLFNFDFKHYLINIKISIYGLTSLSGVFYIRANFSLLILVLFPSQFEFGKFLGQLVHNHQL